MTTAQSAILPEPKSFALYVVLNVKQQADKVLSKLKELPQLIHEINNCQPNSDINGSVAFGAQFWQRFNIEKPADLVDFSELGKGDFIAPATNGDVLIHLHSSRLDLNFYLFNQLMNAISDDVDVLDEVNGFRYLDSRDMTGFVDGTENPKDEQRAEVALIPEGEYAGGSYVMLQRFVHSLPSWNRLSVEKQEKIIGRTKPDSIELDDVPANSHVGRIDIKEEGKGLKIVRHSLPFGTVSGEHGLLFIAYCNEMHNFQAMLNSMYGEADGEYDQLLNFTTAKTGAYFFAPSLDMLNKLEIIS